MLKGIPDDRDGLFDTIQRSKNHYQKRAYQCIKCMVALFSNCSVAYQILQVCSRVDEVLVGGLHVKSRDMYEICLEYKEQNPNADPCAAPLRRVTVT